MKKVISFLIPLLVILSLLCESNYGQTTNSRSKDVIQKGGSKLITDSQGNFNFKIPDSFLKKLKNNSKQYKTKFKLAKIPARFIESKVENIKPNTETQFTFIMKAGFDKKLIEIGKIVVKIKSKEEFNLSRAEITGPMILNLGGINPMGGGNGSGNCMLAGEPITGAEIYVELEPDDEP